MSRSVMKWLGVVLGVFVGTLFYCNGNLSATTVPSMEIDLKDVTLEQIKSGSKDIKYPGNDITIVDGTSSLYSNVEIKGRGNSTWNKPKKPYQIKFSSKENLFGMGKAKKWILLANYFDDSHIRNDIAFYFADLVEMKYVPKGQQIELYVDDQYEGLYEVTTKNEIGSKRLNLTDALGVMMEMDDLHQDESVYSFNSNNGDYFVLKENVSDDDENLTKQALADFQDTYLKFEKALNNADWEKIQTLIDVDSFAQYFVVSEITANPDAFVSSFDLYKDGKSDKIHAGPVWDFDLAISNSRWDRSYNLSTAYSYARSHEFRGNDSNISAVFDKLNSIPEFRTLVKNIFVNKVLLKKADILQFIDTQAAYIQEVAVKDNQKWNRKDFTTEVAKVKTWVDKRLDYLGMLYGQAAEVSEGRYMINGQGTYQIKANSDGSYTIYKGEKVLDVFGLNINIGAAAKWDTYNGGTNQRWYLSRNEDSTYYVISKLTGLVVDLGTMTMQEFSGDGQQKLTLTPITKEYILTHMEKIAKVSTDVGFDNSMSVQEYGWLPVTSDGEMVGTTGFGVPAEAFSLTLAGGLQGIEYRTHVSYSGWEANYKQNGEVSGTVGENRQIEAIQIRLKDELAEQYDVYYRTHVAGKGWTGWSKNNEVSGTTGQSRAIEAIQVKIVEKSRISYQAHVQNYGWMNWVENGKMAGTTGQSLRLEALKIELPDELAGEHDIYYRAHVQDYGWMDWAKNGELAGTTGKSLRLEALEIKLSDELAEQYNVYYRVHVQDYGWMDWVKNGEVAGTTGQSKRLEGIEIRWEKIVLE